MEDAVNRYVEAVKDGIVKRIKKNPKDNMSVDERKAMGAMVEKVRMGEWSVRPADKGGGITVEKRKCVKADTNKELDKADTYRDIEESRLRNTERRVREKLVEMEGNGSVTGKMRKAMQPKNSRQGVMKINRKIHKGVSQGGRYPWRAYVSGIGTAAETVAGLVEHEMKEGVKGLESYVEDSSDFLQKIEGIELGSDEFMFTMDVVALYPSVPREGGREAMHENLEGRVDKTV
jgi:hypothetical protein